MKTIVSVAREILSNFEQKKRNNGKKFYCLRDDIDWQRDIIREAHLDRMPNDDIYERIHDILEKIDNLVDDAEINDVEDAIREVEPDCYTSDLTNWLNESNDNVYYLSQALERTDIKDGFAILSEAQMIYIDDIANALVSAIQSYLES